MSRSHLHLNQASVEYSLSIVPLFVGDLQLDYKPGRTRMQVFASNAPELIALSGRHIRPNYPILVEHGTNYGRPLQGMFSSAPTLTDIAFTYHLYLILIL